MVIFFALIIVSSLTFVLARSIGSVTDTQHSTRNVGTLECDKNCSVQFRLDKIECATNFKVSKKLCREEYRKCKDEAKLLRWINRTVYTQAKIICRDNYISCNNGTSYNRTVCKQDAESTYFACKQNCSNIINITQCQSNLDCNNTQFCSFINCTATQGSCMTVPQLCTEEYNPVCGCDDQTHNNSCFMQMNNQSLRNIGECLII